ncbi:polyketide cyclase [Mixta mediterraneensis]|uniref:polyketide cyclase n=1 Tax=Mixta mediterraneensis TaxID=2758443 RepID=UPI001877101C|nr:polyketide cyclase [Mixta mediterraneensis]MBE5253928.1 polyketide cyclase [Mixta mediterraneensis]
MLPSQTISITIARNWLDLYETIWKPEFFSRWATGLCSGTPEPEGNHWRARGPSGNVRIRFTSHNPFGVMDHWVDSGTGKELYIPMRVIANAHGAEVLSTVYCLPLMSDEKFSQSIQQIKQDLAQLNTILTQ